eukprot:CAMPEP_0172467786 /NCGR_PEP_ID=MMETSP1065-20121228/59826_1 /TAXON_ID=265537 /ORGANISM="Amphiprora paludosa, Strain CCMP125" /LENGTH=270 /DNA_ID=CAMNT_0013225029 /DNA_START=165 /DNA_END=977 /DNA_ORIENTATION=+
MDLPKAFGIGTFAGVLGSLAGMGGGFVMIPLMTNRALLGLSQHQAHGTSLFAVTATGLAGAWSYKDSVRFEEASAIALTGIFTARLGARSASQLSEKALKRALGMLMVTMAPAVHAKQYILQQTVTISTESNEHDSDDTSTSIGDETILWKRIAPASAIGLCSGYLAGLFGVGGGVLVVPALTLFTGCDHYEALGTSLAAMVLPAAAGTLTHYQANNVAIRAAPGLALGACVGAYVGGQVAQQYTNETTLRWGFSGLLVVLGLRTLAKSG